MKHVRDTATPRFHTVNDKCTCPLCANFGNFNRLCGGWFLPTALEFNEETPFAAWQDKQPVRDTPASGRREFVNENAKLFGVGNYLLLNDFFQRVFIHASKCAVAIAHFHSLR